MLEYTHRFQSAMHLMCFVMRLFKIINNEVGTKEEVEYGIMEQANFSDNPYCITGGCILMCYRLLTSRVHNISREGECLTAYTCFKRTASSTKSTPPGVN